MVGLKLIVYSDEGEINKNAMMTETVGNTQSINSMFIF